MAGEMGEVIYLPIDPEIKNHLIITCVGMFMALVILITRLIVRFNGAGFGWDDGLVVVAYLLSVAFLCITATWTVIGEGYDLDPTSPIYPALINNLPTIMKGLIVAQTLYVSALTILKSSVLCFYLRVFSLPQIRLATQVTLGVVIAWGITFILYMLFICYPIHAYWDLTLAATNCGDQILMYALLITSNIITDIVIMLLPMYTIWHLQMKVAEKVALTCSFALGIGCIGLSIARLVALSDVQMQANITGSVDQTCFLVSMEQYLGSMSLSIPALRPLYRRWRSKWSSSQIQETGNDRYYANSKSNVSALHSRRNHMGSVTLATATDLEMNDFDSTHSEVKLGGTHGVDDQSSEKYLAGNGPPKSKIGVETQWTVTRE